MLLRPHRSVNLLAGVLNSCKTAWAAFGAIESGHLCVVKVSAQFLKKMTAMADQGARALIMCQQGNQQTQR